MASVDDRVVQMQFDNKSFEDRIGTTIASIDKLQKSLDTANSSKGLDNLAKAGNNFNLEGISTAIQGVSDKFSAMGAIAFTVLQNITNRAVDAGIKIAKSLSLEQLTSGFREYETNMTSIQTVLANTREDGTTLQDVNTALAELNEYSDKTIYNFGEMAKNIGTFTAAGVGLDDSTKAIKGIANLAAISGSNSQQASTAMYQLSQALAAGKVNLMDWNSVVNAGMGGAVFKKALFETGKAMGTIANVPLGASFDEWEAKGGTFREQMQSGWLTAEVLSTTLQAFSGDLDAAGLSALGFSEAAANEMVELGALGQAAATEVKTITQLMSTLKEGVGSGWSESFKIVIGDFEEAKGILTAFSQALGGIASRSADARNKILKGWKDLGGRNLLIESIVNAFQGLASIVNTVKSAFQDVFPPMTAQRLFDITESLRDFTEKLRLGQETLSKVRHIFVGVFSAISIGWEAVKGVIAFFKELLDQFGIIGSGNGQKALDFFADWGDKLNRLNQRISNGELIEFFRNLAVSFANFVDKIRDSEWFNKIKEFFDYFKGGWTGEFTNEGEGLLLFFNKLGMAFGELKDFIFGLFTDNPFEGLNIQSPEIVTSLVDRIKERFSELPSIFSKVGDSFGFIGDRLESIKDRLSGFGSFLKEKFGGLGQEIANIFAETDYSTALDTINTGLFGGLVLLFRKFINGDALGLGGFVDGITQNLESLTGVLEAMQAKLKSEVLLNIAKALAVLTASVVVLALIDSGALTKSMAALSVGMGQLVGAMALLNAAISGPGSAAKLATVATAITLIAGAMILLSLAAGKMSGLSWEEIAKGLVAVTGLLAAMGGVVSLLSGKTAGMISAGIGMTAIAVALNIMALALKSFAEMNWEGMVQGMAGVAGSLLGLSLAMKAINAGNTKGQFISTGIGMMAIATAMNIMALAFKSFAEMSWHEMAKGMVAVAGGLAAMVLAMKFMKSGPAMVAQGVGLLAVSAALVLVSKAMASIGNMSWGQIAKGLTGIASALVILALAGTAMAGAIPGAIATGIMAISLGKLADVLIMFKSISWGSLLDGLGKLAILLGGIALASVLLVPAAGAIAALGAALLVLGAGMALFGLGANLVASAFSIIATAGTQGVAVLMSALDGLIERLPAIIKALAAGFISLGMEILKALPGLITEFGKTIGAFLQTLIDNIPKFGEVILELITTGLRIIRESTPDFIKTGVEVLMAFLTGIKDNIFNIATTVADIITGFLNAFAEKVPEIIDAVFNLIVSIIEGVIDKLADIGTWLLPKGMELLQGMWDGITQKALEVFAWFVALPGEIFSRLTGLLLTLPSKGRDLIQGLWNGAQEIFTNVIDWFWKLPGKIWDKVGDVTGRLMDKGRDLIQGLWDGAEEIFKNVVDWVADLPQKIFDGFGNIFDKFKEIGKDIIEGIMEGLKSLASGPVNFVKDLAGDILGSVTGVFKIKSPSREMQWIGQMVVAGLTKGIGEDTEALKSANAFGSSVLGKIKDSLSGLSDEVMTMADFNPTITPVLDLSQVRNGAGLLSGMFGQTPFGADLSYLQASSIVADSQNESDLLEETSSGPTEINYNQTIYSPTALSPADIYRRSKSLFAMVKEDLVPA